MAFVAKTTKRKRVLYRIVWHDVTRGAGRAGRREVSCVGGDHNEALDAAKLPPLEREALAVGATNATLRDKLCKCYDALELAKARDVARTAAHGVAPAFETPLTEFIDEYYVGGDKNEGRAGGVWR